MFTKETDTGYSATKRTLCHQARIKRGALSWLPKQTGSTHIWPLWRCPVNLFHEGTSMWNMELALSLIWLIQIRPIVTYSILIHWLFFLWFGLGIEKMRGIWGDGPPCLIYYQSCGICRWSREGWSTSCFPVVTEWEIFSRFSIDKIITVSTVNSAIRVSRVSRVNTVRTVSI